MSNPYSIGLAFTGTGIHVELCDLNDQIVGHFQISWWQLGIKEDDHLFFDSNDELHTCMICGDAADSQNHANDLSVTTTPLEEILGTDDLDELLAIANQDGNEEEDLPLDYD